MKDIKKSEKVYDIEEFRRRKKAQKRRNKIITAIVVAILLALTASIVYFYQNYDIEDLINNAHDTNQVDDSNALGNKFPVSLSGISPISITSAGNELILLTKDEEMFYSGIAAGHNFYHRFTNPIVKTVNGRALTYDRGGYSYRLDSNNGLHLSDRMKNVILTASISDKKSYAIVTKEERYAGSVTVFSKSNEEIIKWYSSSEQIIDVSISHDEKYLAVLCAGFNDGILNSTIYVIDLKRKTEEPKATFVFENSLPVAVHYKKNGQIHVITDNSIGIIVKGFASQRVIAFNNDITGYHFTPEKTFLVSSDINSVSSSVLMTDGENELFATLKHDVSDISYSGRKLYLLGKNRISVLDKELALVKEYRVPNGVYKIEVIGSKIYYLSNNALDVLSLSDSEVSNESEE